MRIKIRNFIFVASFDFAAFSWTLWFKNHDVIVFLRNWSTVVVLLPAAQLSHTSSHHQGRKLVNEWLEASSSATLDLCLPFAHVYLSIASMIYLFLSHKQTVSFLPSPHFLSPYSLSPPFLIPTFLSFLFSLPHSLLYLSICLIWQSCGILLIVIWCQLEHEQIAREQSESAWYTADLQSISGNFYQNTFKSF